MAAGAAAAVPHVARFAGQYLFSVAIVFLRPDASSEEVYQVTAKC